MFQDLDWELEKAPGNLVFAALLASTGVGTSTCNPHLNPAQRLHLPTSISQLELCCKVKIKSASEGFSVVLA